MKRFVFIIAWSLIVAGCSTPKVDQNRPFVSEIGFDMPNGALTLTIDSEGNFVSAKTFATAQVLDDTPAAHEAAVIAAQSRAKRTLAEFMSDHIRSNNSVNQIVNATNESKTYAQEVAEKISTNAQALLRGVYVSKQSLTENTILVELTVTRESIQGARNLRMQMSDI